MNTDDTIRKLVSDAKPVKRLDPPLRRFGRWLVISLLYVVTCLFWIGWRVDLQEVVASPAFIWQTLLLILLAMSSAWLAFSISVPGQEGGRGRKIAVCLIALA
jgi:hypothetical protein